MKKILFTILLSFLAINSSFAKEIDLPKNFQANCFEYTGKVNINGITKIVSTDKIDTFVKNNKIVPFKIYKKSGEIIDYNIDLNGNKKFLQDSNYKTYLALDTLQKKEINIVFNNILKSSTFSIFKSIDSNYYNIEYYISTDNKNYSKVINPTNFDFKYLKIKFIPKNDFVREKIKIYELNFVSQGYIYIVNSKGEITAYANNLCKNYFNLQNPNGNFLIDKNTPTQRIFLTKNPSLNPNIPKDSDNDGIEDKVDNCPNIYNPMQKDSNGDGIGDLCADDDGDSIIGNKDNCINIYNPDQKDINRNGVGDKCEFDKDKDGIFDELDNCITTYNPDQKDDDEDGIGNACDNCKLYNPRQLDKNGNGIGDVCEQHEKYILEHDKDKDKIIDFKDNCPTKYNPNQEDSDGDSIGDVCDNCKNIQNPDQLDENGNSIGDICEDSDGDSIDGLHDNCINIYNSDQKDSDNDGIGDACEDEDSDNIPAKKDNCPYDYNPDQADIDKDGIGNVCDKKDDRFIESNKNIFIVLLVLVVLIFGFAIFKMIKKLK